MYVYWKIYILWSDSITFFYSQWNCSRKYFETDQLNTYIHVKVGNVFPWSKNVMEPESFKNTFENMNETYWFTLFWYLMHTYATPSRIYSNQMFNWVFFCMKIWVRSHLFWRWYFFWLYAIFSWKDNLLITIFHSWAFLICVSPICFVLWRSDPFNVQSHGFFLMKNYT